MVYRRLVVAGLLVASGVVHMAAQLEPPDVQTTFEPPVINVGDPVRLLVTVNHAAEALVAWPDLITLGPFELRDMRLLEPVSDGDRVRSSAELTVTAFQLGELTLPAFEIEVTGTAGDAVMLSTDVLVVTVESVGRDAGGDIRDIRGPLAIPFSVMTLLPWLAGLAGLAAAAYWILQRSRRRARSDVSAPVVPPRLAHTVAYESLNALEASGLLELGEVKTYHIRVSDIMRVYVEGRFEVEAMEMTTGEVLDGLRWAGVASGAVADFRQLLERSDLVKFAKFRPDVPGCRDLVPLGRRLVDVTRPADPILVEAPAEASVSGQQSVA